MNPFQRDAGIPVLTEVIEAPPNASQELVDASAGLETAPAVARDSDSAPAPRFSATTAPTPAIRRPTLQTADELAAEAVANWTPEQWLRLEQALRERVLEQLLQRVEAVLEVRIRDALADALQASVTRMADELRAGLRTSLGNAIDHAIADEISALRFSKSKE